MATHVQAVSAVVCPSDSRTKVQTPWFRVKRKVSEDPMSLPLAGWPAASNTVLDGTMLSRSSVANAASVSTTGSPLGRCTAACVCAVHCAPVLLATMRAGMGVGWFAWLWQAHSTTATRQAMLAFAKASVFMPFSALTDHAKCARSRKGCDPWCSCRPAASPAPSPCRSQMVRPGRCPCACSSTHR